MTGLLKIIRGNVSLFNEDDQVIKTYYTGGDAVRAEWLDPSTEKVIVYTETGKIKLLNKNGQVELIV